MKIRSKLGMLILSIWLILTGLMVLIPTLNFSGSGTVLAVLAIAAGVLILLDR